MNAVIGMDEEALVRSMTGASCGRSGRVMSRPFGSVHVTTLAVTAIISSHHFESLREKRAMPRRPDCLSGVPCGLAMCPGARRPRLEIIAGESLMNSARAFLPLQLACVEANLDRHVGSQTARKLLPRNERHHPQRADALLVFLHRMA